MLPHQTRERLKAWGAVREPLPVLTRKAAKKHTLYTLKERACVKHK